MKKKTYKQPVCKVRIVHLPAYLEDYTSFTAGGEVPGPRFEDAKERNDNDWEEF
ncbi:MAG: hypothetical protein MJY95_05070 [Bacteroidaceae bacterium]|nr:hypothetical protein [Bacteroidaceae bacterium]